MPKSSEIEGLIARLEAATRRAPEIEAAIYNALVGPEDGNRIAFKVKDWSKLPGSRLSPFHDGWLIGKSETDEYADNMPAYTASVDAALALVERMLPGCLVGISRGPNHAKRRRWWDRAPIPWDAYIANNDRIGEPSHAFALTEGSTAPLAILLALLRALSAKAAP